METESSVAAETINVSNAIALRESLQSLGLCLKSVLRVLFNPDTKSANFLLWVVIMCQIMATFLPARPRRSFGRKKTDARTTVHDAGADGELILGKMAPYIVLTFIEFCTRWPRRIVFQSIVHGSFVTLLMLMPFVLTMLGIGLLISTKASTRDARHPVDDGNDFGVPSRGYIFPADSMPAVCRWISYLVPATWLIDACARSHPACAGWVELCNIPSRSGRWHWESWCSVDVANRWCRSRCVTDASGSAVRLVSQVFPSSTGE